MAIRDVLLPRGCAGCDEPDAVLCGVCSRLFSMDLVRPLPGIISGICLCCADYDAETRQAILAWKDHGDEECVGEFGRAMGDRLARWVVGDGRALMESGHPAVALVPVPSSLSSIRRRGRWHMEGLARAVGKRLRDSGIDAIVVPAISLDRRMRRSVEVGGRRGRARRMDGGVSLVESQRDVLRRSARSGACVCVVDDIVTTGETMRRCCRTLREAGVDVDVAMALARTPPPMP